METIKEFLGSVRSWMSAKFATPFFGAFLAAWCTTNWRVIVVMFSDENWHKKITWLDQRLYPDIWHWPVYGVLIPAAIALVYVVVSPWCYRMLSVYARREQHTTTRRLLDIDQIEPITPDQAQRLVNERIKMAVRLRTESTRFAELEDDYLRRIEHLENSRQPPAASKDDDADIEKMLSTVDDALTSNRDHDPSLIRFNREDFGTLSDQASRLLSQGVLREDMNVLRTFLSKGEIPSQVLQGDFDGDKHKVQLFVTRMTALGVIQQTRAGKLVVTGMGHLAAAAAIKQEEAHEPRGFQPAHLRP